jgi:hypothetical protein
MLKNGIVVMNIMAQDVTAMRVSSVIIPCVTQLGHINPSGIFKAS